MKVKGERQAKKGRERGGDTYATLERASINIIAVQLANRHCGILMGIHLDESKTAIGLEARFDNETEVLEQWNKIVLGRIWREVANVAGRLPGGSLGDDHIEAVHTVRREVVMAEGRGGRHAHLRHGLLLGNGRLALLVRPVTADRPGPKPLAIHGAQGLLGLGAVTESDEAVAPGAAGLHVPHDPGFGHRPEGGEGLHKDLVVDFVRQISHKDVEVVGSVLLARRVGLVRPVDADFL